MDRQEVRSVKCRFCGEYFQPQPVVRKSGKKRRTYVECPQCGNGIEREYRPYDGWRNGRRSA